MDPEAKEALRDFLDAIAKGLIGKNGRKAFRDMTDAMRSRFTGSLVIHFHEGNPMERNRTTKERY